MNSLFKKPGKANSMSPASNFFEKRGSYNRRGTVFYGNEGELLKPKRTILSSKFSQIDFPKRSIQIELKVFSDLKLSTIWAKYHDEWINISHFGLKGGDKSNDHESIYVATIDLDKTASIISSQSKYADLLIGEEDAGMRFHLYVEAESNQRRPPVAGREISEIGQGFSFRYPLGKARRTKINDFKSIDTSNGIITPYINKSGFLSVSLNDHLETYASIRNDGIEFNDNFLNIKGRIDSRHSKIIDAKVVLAGRTTGYEAVFDTNLGYLKQLSERKFGHYHYKIEAKHDLSADADIINNDILDYYVELKVKGNEEPVRKRFGKTRFLERRRVQSFEVKSDQKVVSFIPYFTFQAKNPSLQAEVFDENTFKYLEEVKSHAPVPTDTKKPIWLIGEMAYKAQDNGLAFFKYMQDNHKEIDSYYVISQNSRERSNLDGYSNVIDFRSKEHIDVTLAADKIIGTHAPSQLYPTRNDKFVKKIHAVNVFLQHGVTAGKWITPVFGKNASDFNADLIMVCSEREKEFFVHDLGYSADQIAVTGFARFDTLFSEDIKINKKQLFVMPTWRPWLQDPASFGESEYFTRWMNLLTGPPLNELIHKHGLEVVFCLHPNMQQYTERFKGTGARVVFQGEINVQQLIKQSSIMLTDYSSAAMDFAFLHKPVLYYQFDAEQFPPPHADPLAELPGPIAENEVEVIAHLHSILANSGKMTIEYEKRADKFIQNRDQLNSERIYTAISNFETPSSYKLPLDSDLVDTTQKYFRRHRSYSKISQFIYSIARKIAPLNPDVIVFESTLAKSFGGNPKAIYDELVRRGDTRLKVIVCNRHVRIKDSNTVVVKRHSMAFLWYLAIAKYWVNDQNFPHYIRRRKNGIYVQTWHGTPLKKMFLDQENFFGRDAGYITRVKKMAAQWNRLVSPNPHTSRSMRSSYGYAGEIFELGYPRNDILSHPDKVQIGLTMRQRLGIPKDKFVVLYAPTFRDDKPTKRGRFAFDWPFTPSSFVDSLGEDVVLLVRTHNLVSNKVRIPDELAKNVRDVSKYPDIQELFLASDMLITDYSSSFFDYAILNRPIMFFAYDLENYRDSLRGFYLDYEKDLPGPIYEDSDSLFEAIREIASNENANFDIDPDFVERYAPFDDGKASARVIDELLS